MHRRCSRGTFNSAPFRSLTCVRFPGASRMFRVAHGASRLPDYEQSPDPGLGSSRHCRVLTAALTFSALENLNSG